MEAARAGRLGKKPIEVYQIETVRGPRAGALEILAGFDAGRLLSVLGANDSALHRQFVPWDFTGEPSVYMAGRYVRLEAGWPDALAEKDIKLTDVGQFPKGGGRWIAGRNEVGQTITLSLSDTVPHFLFGGWTGSGKTWAMRSALAQLAQDPENRLVFIDGKYGDGLGVIAHLPRLVGPMALDMESVKAALSWSLTEMKRRYQTGDKRGRIIVAVDEVQEFTGKNGDDAIVAMMRTLVSQGRGARVHVLAGTQNPTAKAFSDTDTQRNFVGRVALRTFNYKHSEAVVGGPSPRADWLLGAGDSYTMAAGAVYRAQLAYVPETDLERLNGAQPEMDEWPEFDAEAAGTLAEDDATGWQYSGAELAVSVVQAHLGNGRPTLQRALDNAGLGRPGSGRAERLLGLGREAYQWLRENDWRLCEA
jgi:hypothetical protein